MLYSEIGHADDSDVQLLPKKRKLRQCKQIPSAACQDEDQSDGKLDKCYSSIEC
jgi:hypothetical protein